MAIGGHSELFWDLWDKFGDGIPDEDDG